MEPSDLHHYNHIDPHNATQELLSQTDYCSLSGAGIVEIYVWVKLDEAKQIEDGLFYRLKNIEAIQHAGGENDNPPAYFELIMNNDNCSITKLQENHSEVRKIKRRLDGKVSDEKFDFGSQSSFAMIANDVFKNDPFTPENNPFVTQHREAFSTRNNNIIGETEVREAIPGPSCIYTQGAERMDISAFPLDLPCSTQQNKEQQLSNCDLITPAQRSPQTNVKIPNQELLDGYLDSTARQSPVAKACVGDASSSMYAAVTEDLRLPPPTPSPDSTSCRSIQPESATESRSGILNKLTELDKILPDLKFEDLQHTQTELGCYQVDVMIKEIYCMSSKPLENGDELVVSDWIWGVCIGCGEGSLQSWELREQYSRQAILTGELTCQKCSLVPLRGSNKRRRTKENTLCACMRLVLLLCNPEDEEKSLLASLAGDHAHQFFGVEPKFSWILSDADPTAKETSQKLSTLLDSNLSVTLGISKYIISSGITKFQITNTKLKI